MLSNSVQGTKFHVGITIAYKFTDLMDLRTGFIKILGFYD